MVKRSEGASPARVSCQSLVPPLRSETASMWSRRMEPRATHLDRKRVSTYMAQEQPADAIDRGATTVQTVVSSSQAVKGVRRSPRAT